MKPTPLYRLNLWQSRVIQDAAVWLCAVLAAVVLSIVW